MIDSIALLLIIFIPALSGLFLLLKTVDFKGFRAFRKNTDRNSQRDFRVKKG